MPFPDSQYFARIKVRILVTDCGDGLAELFCLANLTTMQKTGMRVDHDTEFFFIIALNNF